METRGLTIDVDWSEAVRRFPLPSFDGIRAPLEAFSAMRDWPTRADLNALADGLQNARGEPIRFVDAPESVSAIQYETQIAETGQVATRERNWHDFFNACVWLAFPASKGAISDLHAGLLRKRGEAESRARSVERDVLTLFDEGGIVIACADSTLSDAIREFRWRELFWERRTDCTGRLRCFLFGHAQLIRFAEIYFKGDVRSAEYIKVISMLPLKHFIYDDFIDFDKTFLISDKPCNFPDFGVEFPELGVPQWLPKVTDIGRSAYNTYIGTCAVETLQRYQMILEDRKARSGVIIKATRFPKITVTRLDEEVGDILYSLPSYFGSDSCTNLICKEYFDNDNGKIRELNLNFR